MKESNQKGKIKAVSLSKQKGEKKVSVKSAVLKEDFGIVGDAHAGSDRQVSLLAEESIEKMRAKGLKLAPGDFAENITTQGLDLSKLNIGAKLKVGKEAILEIAQIGKVCHDRCSIYYRAGDCIMPREGVFARVLKGGVIRPGDEVEEILTVAKDRPGRPEDIIYRVAVLTISDKCAQAKREDKSGKIIQKLVKNLPGKVVKYEVIPDEPALIKERLKNYCDQLKVDLVLTCGGTGFTSRDYTPEATRDIVEREVPGIPEAMRIKCLKITNRAMLSRGIAGLRGRTLIINLPGSSRGAGQSLKAIIAALPHGLDMLADREHR
jgi:molybdenum cofactor synthesis domain-containing protein